MKASDIDDTAFLDAIDEAIRLRGPLWCSYATRWDVAAVLAGHPEDVGGTPVDYPNMPQAVVLAKARRLINRELASGCACGCRGDLKRGAE
jgi:hypothetical protein